MTTAFILAKYILTIGFVAVLAYALGDITLRRFSPSKNLCFQERIFVGSSIGLVETSIVVLILLIFHLFYTFIVLTLLIVFLLVWAFLNKERFKSVLSKRHLNWNFVMFSAGALTLLIVTVPLALHPATAWDSIEFHIPVANLYSQSHFLKNNPFLRAPFLPQGAEMLFSLVYLLCPSTQIVQLFNVYVFIIIVIGVMVFALRLHGRGAAVTAATTFFGIPLVLWLSSVAYTDMYLTLLLFTASFLIWKCFEHFGIPELVLTGILFAGAISVKDTAVIYWVVALLVTLLFVLKTNRTVLLYHILVTGLLASPWYIRSWILTGNPVYPFGTSVVGNSGPLTETEIQGQLQDLNGGLHGGLVLHPGKFLDVLTNNYGAEGLDHPLSIILFVGVALSLLSAQFWNSRLQRILAIPITFTVYVCYQSIHIRYLFPVLPLLSVLAGIGYASASNLVVKIIRSGERDGHEVNPSIPKTAIITLVAIAGIISGLHYTFTSQRDNGIVLKPAKESAFLATKLGPAYEAFDYLNQNFGSQYSVYAVHQENLRMYCNGFMIGDWFGPDSFFRFFNGGIDLTSRNISSVHSKMKDQNIEFLLIPTDNLKLQQSIVQSFFKVMYNRGGILILKPN